MTGDLPIELAVEAQRYVLEDAQEDQRLEEQSETDIYDYRRELSRWSAKIRGPVLDAGSGSGVVARFLAEQHPELSVVGTDVSPLRVAQARDRARGIGNLSFVDGDLTRLPFADSHFGAVVSRYVLEHLDPEAQRRAVAECFRVLVPGGRVCLIDLDGMYFNLYPRPASLDDLLAAVLESRSVDLQVGRKLPHLLTEARFIRVRWRIETLEFRGRHREAELRLMRQRFANARPFIASILGAESRARDVERDFLTTFSNPGSTLFYNKFIVVAEKPKTLR